MLWEDIFYLLFSLSDGMFSSIRMILMLITNAKFQIGFSFFIPFQLVKQQPCSHGYFTERDIVTENNEKYTKKKHHTAVE